MSYKRRRKSYRKSTAPKQTRKEVLDGFYQNITDLLLQQIQNGAGSWVKCWKNVGGGGLPNNPQTKTVYKGINTISLWCESLKKGFTDSRWGTFKNIKDLGGYVRKDQKGSKVILWKPRKIEEVQSDGTKQEKTIFTFRIFTVFNFQQCEGLPDMDPVEKSTVEDLESTIQDYLKRENLSLQFGGNRAFYSPKKDYIKVPNKAQFKTALHFQSTVFHEVAHSTGHKTRLNRDGVIEYNYFGSHKYSYEELVAELTAVFSMSKLGLMNETSDTFSNSASYLKGWSSKLGEYPEWINKAAREASKATAYIFDE